MLFFLFFLLNLTTTDYAFPSNLSDQQQVTLIELTNFKTTSGTINITEQIGTHYKALGIQLLEDTTASITNAIEKECLLKATDINLKIFERWIVGQGRKPITWASLIEVLRNIGLSELAYEIETNL